MKTLVIRTGLDNYYGDVEVFKTDDSCWIELGCHSSINKVAISEKLWDALADEFGCEELVRLVD